MTGGCFRFDLANGQTEPLETGFAKKNNNDHVLSFDGRSIGISHHSAEDGGKSIVYVVPIEGGASGSVTKLDHRICRLVAPRHATGLHGGKKWRTGCLPDRGAGGDEIRLTDTPGLDDGAEYSPDGQYIYFCSNRSRLMHIWRMQPDGKEPEQLTRDQFNNWFPHVSPDGKWIVFLSFSAEVDPGDHPFYKQVYLRMMPAALAPACGGLCVWWSGHDQCPLLVAGRETCGICEQY